LTDIHKNHDVGGFPDNIPNNVADNACACDNLEPLPWSQFHRVHMKLSLLMVVFLIVVVVIMVVLFVMLLVVTVSILVFTGSSGPSAGGNEQNKRQ
jgi:hypothetical protein